VASPGAGLKFVPNDNAFVYNKLAYDVQVTETTPDVDYPLLENGQIVYGVGISVQW
jgi:hypothetical protein